MAAGLSGCAERSRYDHGVSHEITTLRGNGIRVASERVEGVRSVALGVWIGVGSRDELPARAGVSHFIEHLLFKGSSNYSALEIAERFDAMGGELNAATSRETTVVYVRVPDDRLEAALDVIADMVLRPTFTDLDTEREVVLEEIAMVDDNPQDLVHDLAAEAVFGVHPLGRPVIGRAEVISTVSRRALRGYHRSAYAPGNIVVAAAGNVDHGALVTAVRKRIGDAVGAPGLARKPLTRAPVPGFRFLRKDTEQYHLCVASPGIARQDDRRYALTARRDPRRLGFVEALSGDPREARHGLLRLQLLVAVRRQRSGRDLRGNPRGEPRRVHARSSPSS